jgi:hypothetical protein
VSRGVRALALGGALAAAACAPRPAVDVAQPGPAAEARAAEVAAPEVAGPGVAALEAATLEAIASSERARAGELRVLVARGVTELRWRDESGDRFEQGDADLRWCAGRGFAVSISKLGDRYAWVGSDGRRWWQFFLKAEPSTLRWGTLAPAAVAAGGPAAEEGGGGADESLRSLAGGTPSPVLLGLRPLVPRADAAPEVRGELLWIECEPEGRARVEAAFDPKSLAPLRVRMSVPGGATVLSNFDGMLPVETLGTAQGAWPRMPRRVRIEASGVKQASSIALLLSLESARADADAADRPLLYDLDALRERFAPQDVKELR